ncbi:MAG: hypothetical protein N3E48_04605 [Candidatus Bathyarchaeota archaeon]|nr:hypothetical protein [Candidatus Bathyarchaeota archaeon]
MEKNSQLYPLRKNVKGFLPHQFRIPVSNILLIGHVQELIDVWKDRRVKVGLPDTPPTAYKHKFVTKQIQDIAKRLMFDDKIGFNLKEGKLRY